MTAQLFLGKERGRDEEIAAKPQMFRNVTIEIINLTRANLSQTRLVGADIRGAMLLGAEIRTAIIKDARMDVAQAIYFSQCHGAKVE